MTGNRHERRAKSKRKGMSPAIPSENRLLHQRISVLEASLRRLGEVADANARAFSDSLKMSESLSLVMQRVMNDVANGTVRCFGDEESEAGGVPRRTITPLRIDFNSYMREYWLCMLMADFATWLKSIHKPAAVIQTASKEDVIEFGG